MYSVLRKPLTYLELNKKLKQKRLRNVKTKGLDGSNITRDRKFVSVRMVYLDKIKRPRKAIADQFARQHSLCDFFMI